MHAGACIRMPASRASWAVGVRSPPRSKRPPPRPPRPLPPPSNLPPPRPPRPARGAGQPSACCWSRCVQPQCRTALSQTLHAGGIPQLTTQGAIRSARPCMTHGCARSPAVHAWQQTSGTARGSQGQERTSPATTVKASAPASTAPTVTPAPMASHQRARPRSAGSCYKWLPLGFRELPR